MAREMALWYEHIVLSQKTQVWFSVPTWDSSPQLQLQKLNAFDLHGFLHACACKRLQVRSTHMHF